MTTGELIATISGAERGLGRAIATGLATRGVTVLPTSRDLRLLETVSSEIRMAGGNCRPYQLDVTDQVSIDSFASAICEDFGRIDILVNNAGISIDTAESPSQADLDNVKQTLETNLFGAWRLSKALLPLMLQNEYGRIVNVSSAMGQLENMGCTSPAYRVSKTALNALTCMLAAETEGHDIQVNSVEPGWMRTAMGGPEAPRSPEQGAEAIIWLAMMPKGGRSGSFYFDRKLIPW